VDADRRRLLQRILRRVTIPFGHLVDPR